METMTKVTVTVPSKYVQDIRKSVKHGKARSVSAYITDALETKIDRDDDLNVLEEIIAAHGEPTAEERAWVANAIAKTFGATT
ncbi:MAG: hypothetical protein ACREP9_13920 [Candidatus Dormibacteraceae bacterium]